MNRLPVSADNLADVALPHLHTEDNRPPARHFGEHDLVRKFDELANDELEKFLHASESSCWRKIVTFQSPPLRSKLRRMSRLPSMTYRRFVVIRSQSERLHGANEVSRM